MVVRRRSSVTLDTHRQGRALTRHAPLLLPWHAPPIPIPKQPITDHRSPITDHRSPITFWGGIDTHHILPLGSPADVAAEVQRRIAGLAVGGGYIVGSAHIIQAEVPPENIVAMAQAARS
jgi:uroporphyrinogen-III decarboxylase